MTNSTISSDALSNAIEDGPVFDRMLIYSEEDWAQMRRAAKLFRAIQQLEARSRARSLATQQAAFALGLDRSTVYRLLKKFEGEIVHLFPRRPGPSKGVSCLSNAHEAAVQTVLHRDYLTKQKISVAQLVVRINEACDGKGLKPVSRKAVQARIDRLDQRMVAVTRQ
jgi:putative transposase